MRAVWSFWSTPFVTHYRHTWARPVDHLLSWVASVKTASRHYPETMLVTDTPGRRLLVDQLGLPFALVSTELDRLPDRDAGWWILGKLVAYTLQTGPFIHIDSDVFLWNRLPAHLTGAPVLTQNPEYHRKSDYGIDQLTEAMHDHDGSLPIEWEWASSLDDIVRVENCGILGGQEAPFLSHYARTALWLSSKATGRRCAACPSASGTIARWSSSCSRPASAFMRATGLALSRRARGASVSLVERGERRQPRRSRRLHPSDGRKAYS